MSTDWDSKLVIGSKARAPKVTKTNADINGAYFPRKAYLVH